MADLPAIPVPPLVMHWHVSRRETARLVVVVALDVAVILFTAWLWRRMADELWYPDGGTPAEADDYEPGDYIEDAPLADVIPLRRAA